MVERPAGKVAGGPFGFLGRRTVELNSIRERLDQVDASLVEALRSAGYRTD